MEKILQYAWKWRLYGNSDLRLTDGRKIRILDPGTLNTSDGPDFFNAKVIIDGFEWIGNVELHVRASDWWRHNHHLDPAYANIILHVVAVNDATLMRRDGLEVPQLHFPLSPYLIELYSNLTADASQPPPIRCWYKIGQVPVILTTDAINTAAIERLIAKSNRIISILRRLDGDLAHTCIVALARSLGFGLNSQPFEQLALRLNLNHCMRHSDDPMQLDALVFGTAGLLSRVPVDPHPYFRQLQSEFNFLAHKYEITPLQAKVWKTSGIRPPNSPVRRLAYLSRLIPKASSLLSRIQATNHTIEEISDILNIEFDGFWAEHFTFSEKTSSGVPQKALSDNSLQLIMINAIAPLLHALGILQGQTQLEETAIDLLTSIPPERNNIIRDWQRAGVKPRNALDTQGLLQLRKEYCDRNECLRCRIGNRLMRNSALPVLPVKDKDA